MKIITLYTLISFTSVFGQDVINVDPVGSYASEFPEGDLRSEGAFFGRTVDQMDELFFEYGYRAIITWFESYSYEFMVERLAFWRSFFLF